MAGYDVNIYIRADAEARVKGRAFSFVVNPNRHIVNTMAQHKAITENHNNFIKNYILEKDKNKELFEIKRHLQDIVIVAPLKAKNISG